MENNNFQKKLFWKFAVCERQNGKWAFYESYNWNVLLKTTLWKSDIIQKNTFENWLFGKDTMGNDLFMKGIIENVLLNKDLTENELFKN